MCPLIKPQGPSKVIVQITVMGKGASLLAFTTLEPHSLGSNSKLLNLFMSQFSHL